MTLFQNLRILIPMLIGHGKTTNEKSQTHSNSYHKRRQIPNKILQGVSKHHKNFSSSVQSSTTSQRRLHGITPSK